MEGHTFSLLAKEHCIDTSKLKILRIKKREYRDGIKSRETRPGWGRHTMCMCRYHGGVLSQYVHIGCITQALLHLHILHCDGV